ncbi:hypothetical protein BVRB_8g181670 [Beta vulgaris subsp. vulgaris]|uniref:zingipain-2 n=1 Tax=Beta vulgaris subsp. vulgaris TaxID=3555 RepID=UPI00053F3E63|nr:zingipain-2 [Beta vulgaris subsp. vulgaris]KMT04501.1 hypothetical protein BVRB_8g181670 [Beta vulgaris subsp. vulgaris]
MAAFTNQNFQLLLCFALVLLLGLWATPSLARPLDNHKSLSIRERHELWMARHGRVYKDQIEKEKRLNIFSKNVERIENFNGNASSNKLFTLGVNAFSDLTLKEFVATHTGYKRQFHSKSMSGYSTTNGLRFDQNLTDMPPSLDWREQGAVTPIKDQGQCGCCWAFSTVAAVEGLNQINTGQLISLSEQELVDCVQDSNGCYGGSMTNGFEYIKQNQGLSTEDEYQYQATQGQCGATYPSDNAVTIEGYQRIPPNDEETLMQAVSQQPISIGIDANGFEFLNYNGGVFNGECGQQINHAVTIVGYDTDTDGNNYWLLKNSWGETWGENGYMKIIRDQNQCGITLYASYPI